MKNTTTGDYFLILLLNSDALSNHDMLKCLFIIKAMTILSDVSFMLNSFDLRRLSGIFICITVECTRRPPSNVVGKYYNL